VLSGAYDANKSSNRTTKLNKFTIDFEIYFSKSTPDGEPILSIAYERLNEFEKITMNVIKIGDEAAVLNNYFI